jgi:protein TonB
MMKSFSFFLFFSLTSGFALSQAPTSMSTDTTKATIFETVDVEAEFPGGADSLRKYIIDNIIMDSIMDFSDKEMYNKVMVRFVVNRDGNVEQVTIDRAGDYCPPCNKEALRLVKSMPKWAPGMVNGEAVSMYFRLPIIFAVQ